MESFFLDINGTYPEDLYFGWLVDQTRKNLRRILMSNLIDRVYIIVWLLLFYNILFNIYNIVRMFTIIKPLMIS